MRIKLISIFTLILLSTSSAIGIDAFDKDTFGDFDIISADKLNYADGNLEMTGGVKIRFGEFTITAPRLTIDNDENAQPQLIDFLDNVELNSEKIKINSAKMQIDLKNNLFKCFPKEDNSDKVLSILKNKDEEISISAAYQDYNLDTGLARARGINGEQIVVKSVDRTIYADNSELNYNKSEKGDQVDTINFNGNVTLLEKDKRIEADDVFYWVAGDTIKAYDDVKIAYHSEKQGLIHLFADSVTLENEADLLSAYSYSLKPNVFIYTDNMYGNGRQLMMQKATTEADKAVLSGSAYAQLDDKAITGDEILFNIKERTISSLISRPSTKILNNKTAKK